MYMGALTDILFSTLILRENLGAVCDGEVITTRQFCYLEGTTANLVFLALFANHQDHYNKDINQSATYNTGRPVLI